MNSKSNNKIQVQNASLLNKGDDKFDRIAENDHKLNLLGIKF